ncbi:MAG: hypothetical protein ACXW29_07230 [Thermoanaerobaculia bacterium]
MAVPAKPIVLAVSATVLALKSQARSGSRTIARKTRATPGVSMLRRPAVPDQSSPFGNGAGETRELPGTVLDPTCSLMHANLTERRGGT